MTPETFLYEMRTKVICSDGMIAGGLPMRLFGNMSIDNHDIDVWFKSAKHITRVTERFLRWCNVNDVSTSVFGGAKYFMQHHTSDNADTFTFDNNHGQKLSLQLIKRQYMETEQDVLDFFDIRACKVLMGQGGELYASDETKFDIANKILHFDKIKENSLKRFTKYVAYGFKPDRESINGIIKAHNEGIIQTKFDGNCDDYQ